MSSYLEYRKTYCECCDSRDFCIPRKIPEDNLKSFPYFIDWDAVKTSKRMRWKSCDAIYDQNANTIFFIEFKNFTWFIENSREDIRRELVDKFSKSYELYLRDDNTIETFECICAFNENKNEYIDKKLPSHEYNRRQVILSMYEFLLPLNIKLRLCNDAFYHTVY